MSKNKQKLYTEQEILDLLGWDPIILEGLKRIKDNPSSEKFVDPHRHLDSAADYVVIALQNSKALSLEETKEFWYGKERERRQRIEEKQAQPQEH